MADASGQLQFDFGDDEPEVIRQSVEELSALE